VRVRFITLVAAVAAILVVCLALLAPKALAQGVAGAAQSGVLAGTVVNGTHGNAPVTGQMVTLEQYVSHATTQDIAHVTTDAHGSFTFSGLDGTGATDYVLRTTYQNGQFSSGIVTLANGGAVEQLVVYDTTTNDEAVSISLATILINAPNTQTGMVPIGVFVTFENTGHTAFVATPGAENGKPTGLLRFALPPGATNVSLGAGFAGAQTITVGSGFASTGTLPPGKAQLAFAYEVPYSATDYIFPYSAEYVTAQVAVLVPFDMQVVAGDFAAQQPVEATGQRFHLLTKANVAAGAVARLRIRGLPQPGEPPDLSFGQLVGVGGGLALLLALLLLVFLRRGYLARTFRLLPAAAVASTGSTASQASLREDERQRLLHDLLALEQAHKAGTLREAEFQRRREAVRGQLRALLAATMNSTTSMASTVSTPSTADVAAARPDTAETDVTPALDSPAVAAEHAATEPPQRRPVRGGKR
jgi:hypothetical protein